MAPVVRPDGTKNKGQSHGKGQQKGKGKVKSKFADAKGGEGGKVAEAKGGKGGKVIEAKGGETRGGKKSGKIGKIEGARAEIT